MELHTTGPSIMMAVTRMVETDMPNYIDENPVWVDKIFQYDEDTPVLGGVDGPDNWQAQALANRTQFLRTEVDKALSTALTSTGAYASRELAQKAIDDGLIPLNSLFNVHSDLNDVYYDQYENLNGTATPTGKSLRVDWPVGQPIHWDNINLSAFDRVNANRLVFSSSSTEYQEAKGTLPLIPAGTAVDIYFLLNLKSGVAPTVRLRDRDWSGPAVRLTPSAGVLKATLTATTDATEIRLYSDTGNTTDCELYMFVVYGNDSPVTSTVINLINEAQNSREYAERGIRISGYSTFKITSPNTFEVNGDGTGYGEVRLSMLPIKSGGVFRFKYKIASTAGWTYVRLLDSSTGSFVSAVNIITTDDLWRFIAINTNAEQMVDTVLIYTRTQATPISSHGFFNLMSVDGVYFSASQAYHDTPPDDVGIGMVPKLVNTQFDLFKAEGGNLYTFRTDTKKWGEAQGDVSVAAGQSATLYYRLLNTAGGTPFVRLHNGTTWVSDEYPLVYSLGLSSVTLLATSAASKFYIYCKQSSTSYGRLWAVLTGSPYTPETLLTEQLSAAILQSSAYVESGQPVGIGFTSFKPTSNNSWKFSADGTIYTETLVTIPRQPAGAKLRVMYAIDSNGANTYIRLRHSGGWASVETRIVTDGNRRYIDLQSNATAQAYGIVVYSRVQDAFFGTALVALVAVNDTFVSSSTAVNELASGSSDADTQQSTEVLFPSSVYFIAGRPVTLYGSNMVAGARSWSEGANLAVTSIPVAGKPAFFRSAYPDVTFTPDEIGGETIDIMAREDEKANAYRKPARINIVTPTAGEVVKICALMDSHGAKCVPWLSRAVSNVGAVYQGIGMYSIEGIPFEGRAGWSTFSYMGRRAEEQFTNPFLKPADQSDFDAHPEWCYAADYSGVSYAENPNLSSYHVFDVTAWKAARGLATNDKLVVVMQLGVNDRWRKYAASEVAAAQEFMISQFKAVLPNVRFVVSSHSLGWTNATEWTTYTPYITEKLIKFDARENESILQAPAWAMMSAKYGWDESVVSTSPTGVVEIALNDDVHPGPLGDAQWADALIGATIAAWHL